MRMKNKSTRLRVFVWPASQRYCITKMPILKLGISAHTQRPSPASLDEIWQWHPLCSSKGHAKNTLKSIWKYETSNFDRREKTLSLTANQSPMHVWYFWQNHNWGLYFRYKGNFLYNVTCKYNANNFDTLESLFDFTTYSLLGTQSHELFWVLCNLNLTEGKGYKM